jgi:hypothetical protein
MATADACHCTFTVAEAVDATTDAGSEAMTEVGAEGTAPGVPVATKPDVGEEPCALVATTEKV